MKSVLNFLHHLRKNRDSFRAYSEARLPPNLPSDQADPRCIGARFTSLMLESDPTPTKASLATFAALTALFFWLDKGRCGLHLCDALENMTLWIGGYKAWGVAWTVYAIAQLWRIFEGVHRPAVAYVLNFVGAAMFGATAVASLIARWPNFLVAVPYLTLALASIWVAARTAINPGRGFRGD